jgi:hypothetical protein
VAFAQAEEFAHAHAPHFGHRATSDIRGVVAVTRAIPKTFRDRRAAGPRLRGSGLLRALEFGAQERRSLL